MEKLNILEQREITGKTFTIYGTAENPLFLAKEVADMIEHSKADVLIASIDNAEKVKVNNVYVDGRTGGNGVWFLTEDGLYEVLMQSRKPIAKQFKTKVKEILRTIRKTGTYSAKPETSPEPVHTPAIRTYRDRRVLTVKDIAQLIGKDEHALVYYLRNKKSKCKEGTDYYLLKGDELRQFKKDNNLSTYPSSLFVVLESGFRKLCKFFGIKLDMPTLFPAKVPALAPATVPVATVVEKPKLDLAAQLQEQVKQAKEALIALNVTIDMYIDRPAIRKVMGNPLHLMAANVTTEIAQIIDVANAQAQLQ